MPIIWRKNSQSFHGLPKLFIVEVLYQTFFLLYTWPYHRYGNWFYLNKNNNKREYKREDV